MKNLNERPKVFKCVTSHANIKQLNRKVARLNGCPTITSDRGTFSVFIDTEEETQYLAVWSYETLVSLVQYEPKHAYGCGVTYHYLREDMLSYSNTTSKLMNYLITNLSRTLDLYGVRALVKKGGDL